MWVDVIKADIPSLNGNIYPELILKDAVFIPSCQIYTTYCKSSARAEGGFEIDEENNPAIGKAIAYRVENGWFQALIQIYCPHFVSLVNSGQRVIRAAAVVAAAEDAAPIVKRIVAKIERIDHLALCNPEEASWTALTQPDSSSARPPSPESTSTPTGPG